MITCARLWLGLSLAACADPQAAPPQAPPPPPPVASAPPPAASSAQAAPPPRPALPPAVREPVGAVCLLSVRAEKAPMQLFLPGKSQPFASLTDGRADLSLLPSGEPVVAVSAPGAVVRAEGRFAVISVRPQRAIVFGGVAVPSSLAELKIAAVSADGLTLVHTPHLAQMEVRPGPLRATVGCKEVGLQSSPFSGEGVVPSTSSGKPMELRDGRIIPLRASEQGEPVLEVQTPKRASKPGKRTHEVITEPRPQVSVVKTSGKLSLVVVTGQQTTLFGWVPSADLAPAPRTSPAGAALEGLLGLGARPEEPEQKKDPQRVCEVEVPLLVEQEGERVTLGSTPRGVCMDLRAQGQDMVPVGLRRSGLQVLAGARLLAPSWALAGCHAPTPEDAVVCDGPVSDIPPAKNPWGTLRGFRNPSTFILAGCAGFSCFFCSPCRPAGCTNR